jgi:hypothetical protein
MFDRARNQFTIEACTDQHGRFELAMEIAGTGNETAVPETPDLQRRRGCRLGARLTNVFVPQGAVQQPQQ